MEQHTATGLVCGAPPGDSECLSALLFATAREGILLQPLPGEPGSGPFIAANPAICRMLGYTAEELRHLTLRDLQAADAPAVTPETAATSAGEPCLTTLVGKDGRHVPVEIRCFPCTREGEALVLCLVRDVSGYKASEAALLAANERLQTQAEELQIANEELQAQREELAVANEELQVQHEELTLANQKLAARAEALRRSENRYRELVQNANSAIIRWKRDGTITFFNEYAQTFFGYSPDAVLGQHLSLLIPPVECTGRRLSTLPEEIVAHPERYANHVNQNVCRDGRQVWMAWTHRPVFDENGQVVEILSVGSDITHRQQAEEALRRSEAYFRGVFNNIAIGIVQSNPEGRICLVNDTFCALLGYSRDELIGQHVLDITHPEDREVHAQHILRSLAGETDRYEMDKRYLRKDGTIVWAHLAVTLVADDNGQPYLTIGVVRDITQRKQTEESLRWYARRNQILSHTARRLLATDDPQGLIEDLCRRVMGFLDCQVFLSFLEGDASGRLRLNAYAGISAAEAREEGWPDHQMAGSGRATRDYRRVIIEHVAITTEPRTVLLRRCGIQAYCCHPLIAHGRLLGTLSFGTRLRSYFQDDEVELMRIVADQVAVALERLRAQQALQEADRRKDEFLAMLAHELRNPLAAITSAVQLLQRRGTTDPSCQRAQDAADRQSRHMARLLDDLLDVSRVTQGKIMLRKEPVSLAEVLESAVEASGPVMEQNRHRLSVSLPPESLRVHGDAVRLAQVVSNLLINAAKYTPPGGEIHLSLQREEGEAVIRVRDNGVGILPEMLPDIFGLFVQGERGLDRVQGGLGIGLTLVRSLVQMHGGRVEAFSEGPGRGSEFVVWLPILAVEAAAAPTESNTCAQPAARRILVVDDNADAAEMLAMLLELDGFEVRTVGSGPEALQILCPEATADGDSAAAAHPQPTEAAWQPDVVLLDIGLPGMDGLEVARRIRLNPALARVKLIAVTGYGQDEDVERSRAAGMANHLTKPVDLVTLRRLLRAG